MKVLHKSCNLGLMLVLAIILASCSGGGNTPVQSNLESGISDSSQDNISSPGEMPDISVDENDSNRTLLGMYTVEFDPQSMIATVQPNRASMAHYNVTTYLPPQISIISVDTVTNIWTVKITIKNTFSINGYDLRLIVYTDNTSLKLQNPDNWTAQWDIPGGMQINPFIAFSKSDNMRKFEAGSSYSEIVQVYLPVLASVKLAIDVSYPGNCLEPYEITHTINGKLFDKGSGNLYLQARVNDHQRDVNQVVLYCPAITGVTYVPLARFSQLLWEMNLENANQAAKGKYSAVLIATSAGSGTIALYDLFTLEVEHTAFPNELESVNTWGCGEYYGYGYCEGVGFDDQENIYACGSFKGTVDFGDGNQITAQGYTYDACLVKYNANGTLAWAKQFGSSPYQSNDACRGLAIDGSGYIAVAGSFQNTVDFGDGPRSSAGLTDIFVVKYSTEGVFQWAKTIGGSNYDAVESIITDDVGNVYITGNFTDTVDFGNGPVTANGYTDAYLCKFYANGSFAWVKIISGSDQDNMNNIAIQGDNLYVCGTFSGTVDFGDGNPHTASGYSDLYFLVLDTNKSFEHVTVWDDTGPDWINSLAVDSSGNIFLTGSFGSAIDFGGGPVTSKGEFDCYLLKLDSEYNFNGVITWGGTDYDSPRDLVIGDAGNVYVAGTFGSMVDFGDGIGIIPHGNGDAFICKFTPAGAFKGVKTFGGAGGWTHIESIDSTTHGDVCYGGSFETWVDFGDGNPIEGCYDYYEEDTTAFVANLNDLE